MIEPGRTSDVSWGEGNWVFVDIGFAARKRTCGFLSGESNPLELTFGEVKQYLSRCLNQSAETTNLVIEAPLSVCFSQDGNPRGRAIEAEGTQRRYWYLGLGCGVMVAAAYLIRSLVEQHPKAAVRLFEGFVSFQDRSGKSNHWNDVLLLKSVVKNPERFSDSILDPDSLKANPTDKLMSAFQVIGIDCGIPAVIKVKQSLDT